MAKKLYNVLYSGVRVYQSDNDVQALGFALGLHQQSNVPHEIKVVLLGEVSETVATLIVEDNA